MTAISRKAQQIFGVGLSPTGNIANFGSLAAGTPTYSDDPDTIQTAAWLNGLAAALIGNRSPALEDLNGVLYVLTRQLAYQFQQGIPEWLTTDVYYTGSLVQDGAGNVYVSLTNGNTGHALSDTNNWVPYGSTITGTAVCRAWVEFDGINATGSASRIISSFNVSGVTKNAAGNYTINFTNAMPSANYAFSGSCGSEDGQAYGAGDDGKVVGNVAGQGNAVRSATQCRVFTTASGSSTLVASGCVSVMFFG